MLAAPYCETRRVSLAVEIRPCVGRTSALSSLGLLVAVSGRCGCGEGKSGGCCAGPAPHGHGRPAADAARPALRRRTPRRCALSGDPRCPRAWRGPRTGRWPWGTCASIPGPHRPARAPGRYRACDFVAAAGPRCPAGGSLSARYSPPVWLPPHPPRPPHRLLPGVAALPPDVPRLPRGQPHRARDPAPARGPAPGPAPDRSAPTSVSRAEADGRPCGLLGGPGRALWATIRCIGSMVGRSRGISPQILDIAR